MLVEPQMAEIFSDKYLCPVLQLPFWRGSSLTFVRRSVSSGHMGWSRRTGMSRNGTVHWL